MITTIMREEADDLRRATDAAYSAEVLKADLVLSRQLAALYGLTQNRAYRNELVAVEGEIRRWYEHFHGLGLKETDRKLIEKAMYDVDRFLRASNRTDADHRLTQEAQRESEDSLLAAFQSLRSFANTSLERVENLQSAEANWDRMGNILGAVVTSLLLLGMFLLIMGTRHLFYLPLRNIESAIARYANGNSQIRLPKQRIAEIQSIADAFNDMADRLALLERDRLRFLAGVAHELRHPLTAMKAATELLCAGGDQELPKERSERVFELLAQQVSRLETMTNDLLDTTRIQAGNL